MLIDIMMDHPEYAWDMPHYPVGRGEWMKDWQIGGAARLTKREIAFLARERIPTRWVMNARPFRDCNLAHCRQKMVETSTYLAFCYGPRCGFRHRLMNRRGKCVQCDQTLLERTRMSIRYAYVYLAESVTSRLVKVGSCTDLDKRERELNRHDKYAGATDWRIRASHYTIAAGMFEESLKRRLRRHQVACLSDRYGKPQQAREAFRCSYRTARRYLARELKSSASFYAEIEAECGPAV